MGRDGADLTVLRPFFVFRSTVDSQLISANNVFTVDILKNWLMKDSSTKQLVMASLVVSPVFLIGSAVWAFNSEKLDLAFMLEFVRHFPAQFPPF